MKKVNTFRVLLRCGACDKTYNGTNYVDFKTAMKYYHSTLINNKDVCTNEECEKPLIPVIEDSSKPKEAADGSN